MRLNHILATRARKVIAELRSKTGEATQSQKRPLADSDNIELQNTALKEHRRLAKRQSSLYVFARHLTAARNKMVGN